MGEVENIAVALAARSEISASDLFHAEWERARAIHLNRYWSGASAPAERHAEARLLWTDEALLVRFLCRQSEPLVINSAPRVSEKTVGLWERDVCEIFIAPDARAPYRYFEFEAAPTGEWIDLAIQWTPEARRTDWNYNSGITANGSIEEERVSLAMRVPWEAFGRDKPQAGERWRVNLFRCVGKAEDRGYLAWQPTRTPRPNFHLPQAFGWLRFDE